MIDLIKEKLHELEEIHSIRILYACESGSRAWGFPSPDSDFDVRFIYARSANDYLSIHDIKDIIDLPVDDELDIGGWDIKKALKLFLKSNAPLYEWLQSPIIYIDNAHFATTLRNLMPKYFSLRSGGNHYVSIGLNTLENDLQFEQVKLKRCFYALRSILACKWIIKKQTVPPMELGILRTIERSETFQKCINDLLTIKSVSNEKTLIKPIAFLDEWLNNSISSCKILLEQTPVNRQLPNELNDIFRRYIVL